ncbi:ABC transporter permease [Deferribacter thermophilus]|uniref:ABC transporter permease n=1 Tax=Deferribacter thermophilus TaxID=53573 RepID=UPI003C2CC04C
MPFLLVIICILPIWFILSQYISTPTSELVQIFKDYQVLKLIKNTLVLLIMVSVFSFVLGVSVAWIIAMYEFPLRKFVSVAFLFPLAVPAYVFAFVYTGLFDNSGLIQALYKIIFNKYVWFDGFRTPIGVAFILSLSLYPYVYIIVRNAFETQGSRIFEVSKIHGVNKRFLIFKLILPMASPWIAGSMLLVAMETMADFGAVSIIGYDTFTTAIYKAWYGFYKLEHAVLLSGVLVIHALVLLVAEKLYNKRKEFYSVERVDKPFERKKLKGFELYGILFYLFLILFFSLLLPFIQLLLWCFSAFSVEFSTDYINYIKNTLLLSFAGVFMVLFFGYFLAYYYRNHKNMISLVVVMIATAGYAIPGSVLAVGFYTPITKFFYNILDMLNLTEVPQLLTTLAGLFILILGYTVRYVSLGYNTLYGNLSRIKSGIFEQARLLDVPSSNVFKKIIYPSLKGSFFSAAIMSFLDIAKEMPITLMTRPAGWDTLAVRIFGLTAEGEWERASIPSLILVILGILPILVMVIKPRRN